MFYSPSEDKLYGPAKGLPGDAIELDPVKSAMFLYAEERGHRVSRDAITAAMLTADVKAAARVESRRAARNTLLAQSDWTQISDASADKEAWAEYRQALRDLNMAGDDWPEMPARTPSAA